MSYNIFYIIAIIQIWDFLVLNNDDQDTRTVLYNILRLILLLSLIENECYFLICEQSSWI